MQKRWAYFLISALVLSQFSFPKNPANTAKADSVFNPNNLVSDSFYTATFTMSVSDIQAFLVKKGSVLTKTDPSLLGDGNNGRSAAQIIYDASRATLVDFARSAGYGPGNPLVVSLNPEVILATLQKEQSLVTDTSMVPGSANTQTALDWAMGMGCPDGGGCNQTYKGFTTQVVYGTAQLYFNYLMAQIANNSHNSCYDATKGGVWPWVGNTVSIDSTSVTFSTASTAGLYCYTPHIYNGNYNFWRNINSWFTPVGFQPTLSYNAADGTLYAISGTTRYPITGRGFAGWGLQNKTISGMTADQLAFPVGSTLSHLALGSDGSVYYMDNGYKRPFTSVRIFDKNGFSWSDVKPVDSSILDATPYGLPMYELVRIDGGDGTVYLATSGTLYPINFDTFFNGWTFTEKEVGVVPSYVLANLPIGSLLNRYCVAEGSDGTVLMLDHGVAYGVSAAMAKAWNMDSSKVSRVDIHTLYEHSYGGLLSNLVQQIGGDGTVYLMQNGTKYPIARSAWLARGYKGDNVQKMTVGLLNAFPTGATIR